MARNKKRKKKSNISNKQERAGYLKEYKDRLLRFIKAAGLEEAYRLIPTIEKGMILAVGMKSMIVLPAKGEDITNITLKTLKKLVHNHMKGLVVNVNKNGTNVSLYEYYFAGEWITYMFRSKGCEFKNKEQALVAAKDYMECVDEGMLPRMLAEQLGLLMTYLFCSPSAGYVLFELGTYEASGAFPFAYECYYIRYIRRESLLVELNGKRRTVYRLGFPANSKEIKWVSISAEKMGMQSSIANLQIDVYIQKHALIRMKERLDVLNQYGHNCLMHFSFNKCIIKQNKCKQKMIQFLVEDHPVGYFRYEYVEGIIVITTFLLITNNGTPEGEKLHDMLGIQKKDKQYLGIDKLSGFTNTDLKNDERIIDIFSQAGCQGLFNISEAYLCENNVNDKVVERFMHYLELDKEPDEEFIFSEMEAI